MAGEPPITINPYLAARFWSKVDVGRPGVCWEWKARSCNEHGYGVIRVDGRLVKAHRLALIAMGVDVPGGAVVMHACDNPPCCNPAHLRVAAQADNIADMYAKGRRTYRSKVGADGLAEARKLSSSGATHEQIADLLGCSASYVSMLLGGTRGASFEKGIA